MCSATLLAAEGPLTMDLTGTIAPRCELAELEQKSASFDDTDTQTITLSVYCNTEMSMMIESQNGGLLNQAAAARLGDIDGLNRRYEATLRFEKLGFEQTFPSTDLVGGASFPITGGVLFEAAGELEIKLDSSPDEGHAGTYSDKVTLTVFPSLAGFN